MTKDVSEHVVPWSAELTIEPIPPDSLESLYQDFPAQLQELARSKGQEGLLESGELSIEPLPAVPDAKVVEFILTVSTPIAVWFVEKVVVPWLDETYSEYVLRKKSA